LLYKFDQDDGHAFLENIDAQQWSQGLNGHIAMEGWSNGGICAYLAAQAFVTVARLIKKCSPLLGRTFDS
jgi:hypothetical protein